MNTNNNQSQSCSQSHIPKVELKFVSNQTYAATIKCNSARHTRSNKKSIFLSRKFNTEDEKRGNTIQYMREETQNLYKEKKVEKESWWIFERHWEREDKSKRADVLYWCSRSECEEGSPASTPGNMRIVNISVLFYATSLVYGGSVN